MAHKKCVKIVLRIVRDVLYLCEISIRQKCLQLNLSNGFCMPLCIVMYYKTIIYKIVICNYTSILMRETWFCVLKLCWFFYTFYLYVGFFTQRCLVFHALLFASWFFHTKKNGGYGHAPPNQGAETAPASPSTRGWRDIISSN